MNEYEISPEELFFLGALLQAKYIDYAYIAAMDDIQDNFSLKKKETIAGLVNRGVIQEDFSGDLEVCMELRTMLDPVFFGIKETSLDICYLCDNKHVDIFKFHHKNGKITLVTGNNRMLVVKTVEDNFFPKILNRIISDEDDDNILDTLTTLENETISKMIAVKSSIVGGTSKVYTYFEVNNHLYTEREMGLLQSISKTAFVNEACEMLRGDHCGV